jgi:hypothetical protein
VAAHRKKGWRPAAGLELAPIDEQKSTH